MSGLIAGRTLLVGDVSPIRRLRDCLSGGPPLVGGWTSIAIAALAAAVLFSHLDDRDLWPSHEARAAQNALGLLETGHFGLLRLLDGTPENQKPPLYYWLVAALAWVRGGVVDAWSVRLPAAIGGWLSIVAVMAWLHRRGRPRAGQFAGIALLCAHHVLSTSRTGRIDAALMAATTLALLGLLEGRTTIAGACLGAALLLKGPIGLAICFAVVGSWWLIQRSVPWTRFALAITVAIVVAGPWFTYVTWETGGEFARAFFWRHNVQRATGGTVELASHPVWFYPLRWMVDGLPISLVGIPLLIWAARRTRDDPEFTLGLAAALAITALLTLSRFKRADYLMPAYPWAAIAIGCAAERVGRRWSRPVTIAMVLASSIGGMVHELWLLPRADAILERKTPAAEVRAIAGPEAPIIFFRVEDHALALHIGKPLMSVREWENLDVWASRLQPGFIIMPADCADSWPAEIRRGRLREVFRHADPVARDRPRSWVLMRSEPVLSNE